MTAPPDDAAGSDVPPRRDRGPAAPLFPGTPGPQRLEEAPMPPQHDETVRLATGAPSGRPSPTGQRPAVDLEADDTRPVGREWLHGSPEPGPLPEHLTAAGHGGSVAASDEWGTQKFDLPPGDTPLAGPPADDPSPLADLDPELMSGPDDSGTPG